MKLGTSESKLAHVIENFYLIQGLLVRDIFVFYDPDAFDLDGGPGSTTFL
jgi:hypothetical protein